MLSNRALSVIVVALIVASAAVPLQYSLDDLDSYDEAKFNQIFLEARHATSSFATEIQRCVEKFADNNKFVFTIKDPPNVNRFTEKCQLAQQQVRDAKALLSSPNTEEYQKWETDALNSFKYAFRDLSGCRFTPQIGQYNDVDEDMKSLIESLVPCLKKNYEEDSSWRFVHTGKGADDKNRDNMAMRRLFITLNPEDEATNNEASKKFGIFGHEIQVIASPFVALAFSANSDAKYQKMPFPSPFQIYSTVDRAKDQKLSSFMVTENFATNAEYRAQTYKQFADNASNVDVHKLYEFFTTEIKKNYEATPRDSEEVVAS